MAAARPMILSHDGSVDDLLALLLLLTIPNVDLKGVVVTSAGCLGDPAVRASRAMLDLFGRADVPVGLSRSRGLNAFPYSYRLHANSVELLPLLNRPQKVQGETVADGDALFAELLQAEAGKTDVLALGPMTTIADLLAARPDLKAKIGRVVWIGGAVDAPGNVNPEAAPGGNPEAEWNAYWDPQAVETAFAAGLDLTLLPLDVTNCVPVRPELVRELGVRGANHALCDLAAQCYALSVTYPDYCMWDVVAAAFIGAPHLFEVTEVKLRCDVAKPHEGRTRRDPNGHSVKAVLGIGDAELKALYDYLFAQWSLPLEALAA